MASASPGNASEIREAVLAIGAAGLIAGTLDLGETLVVFGAKSPLAIAAGMLGQNAFRGGAAIYILGVLLHYLIVFSAAAIYFAASRRLHFLIEYRLICGLFFGGAIDAVAGTCGSAAFGAAREGTISVPRFSSGAGCPHGPRWPSYIVQRSAVWQGN